MRLRQRMPREHDDGHLAFIRQLPCLICGDNTSTEAAHIRMADLTVGKPYTGKSQKASDYYVVPLCGGHHRDQHGCIEHLWWMNKGLDGIKIAQALWINSGNYPLCSDIVDEARRSVR